MVALNEKTPPVEGGVDIVAVVARDVENNTRSDWRAQLLVERIGLPFNLAGIVAGLAWGGRND